MKPQRAVLTHESYRNQQYVLVAVDQSGAEDWARHNRPSGWSVAAIAKVRGTQNYGVRFNKDH